MGLRSFQCKDFRCLEFVELELNKGNNLIYGENASGKTSILEAVAYLGRARSFRGAGTPGQISHGAEELLVTGNVDCGTRRIRLGVRNGQAGLEVHADGEKTGSAAPLAEALPLPVIDPAVHGLVAGGPEGRRRYLDWIAFHVEHHYLDRWRRFRRALKQRNAALRGGAPKKQLASWDQELTALGLGVDEARRRVLELTAAALEGGAERLLGSPVRISYNQGWPAERSLAEALAGSIERDRQLGSTQAGPHRADLRLIYDERQARKLVSRGQQKLLACSMILAATEVVQTHLERPLLLLLDDPAAELDAAAVARLMDAVNGLGAQVIATTLDGEQALFDERPTMFHVEQGRVETAA